MIALVTGGAHGVGAAIVRRLTRGDADVRSFDANENAAATAVDRFGGLDLAAFNAGVTGPRAFSVSGCRDTVRVNPDAAVYGVAARTKVMSGGSVPVVASRRSDRLARRVLRDGEARPDRVGAVRAADQAELPDQRAVPRPGRHGGGGGAPVGTRAPASPDEVAVAAETVLGAPVRCGRWRRAARPRSRRGPPGRETPRNSPYPSGLTVP